MLYFNRIDVSEGIDVNKTSALKDYDICHYWYFLKYSFKFQPNVSKLFKHQKWGHKLNTKCRFDRKKQNIIKHKQFVFIYKNGKKF